MVALPSVVRTQRAHLDVKLTGTFTAGATSVDLLDMLEQVTMMGRTVVVSAALQKV